MLFQSMKYNVSNALPIVALVLVPVAMLILRS